MNSRTSPKIDSKWDEEADVIIVGSGFAGLAAAIEAGEAGASVLILEKMRVPGGNSIINGGAIAAAGSQLQEKEGIEDSPELMYEDMLKAGLGLNHPDLARIVAERSNETLEWTMSYLGVRYKDRLTHFGGHTVPRTYTTYNNFGSAIVRKQLERVRGLGMEVQSQACLARLIKNGDGRVKGAEIRDGYLYGKAGMGPVKHIKAKRALVLATGGFSNDITFRSVQDPRLTKDVPSTNHRGATAEALLEALRVGAMPLHLSWIQLGPWASPDEKGFGLGPIFTVYSIFPYGVMVDPSTGRRFVNELEDRKNRTDGILRAGRPCIGIVDRVGVQHAAHVLDKSLKRGVVKRFNTLEGLASAHDIPLRALGETIENFNAYVEKGKDEAFGRRFRKDTRPLRHPPYYAIRLWPKVHHTMGGIRINTRAQVVDLTHRPIKGLYAAGEVTGGIHGAVRLGSNATTECLTFGRIAGQNAARERPWA